MNKIQFIREVRGYPQEKVAEKLAMAQNTYSRYESNPKRFSEDQINELANFFGVAKEDLLNEEPVIINLHNTNGYIQTENFYFNTKELIDKLIQSKDEEITTLKTLTEELRIEIKDLKSHNKSYK